MRTIPSGLAADLSAGVTTLAHVWRFTRRDGGVFGFTDHDQSLSFDAIVCEPNEALAAGAIEKSLGLGVDTASVAGALSSDAISEEDLKRGLWDGARVDIYRVDWRDVAQRIHLFAGRIGEVRRGAHAFEAELRGLQAALNTPVGRVFSRFCDADLGDARCAKDIDTASFKGEGVVSAVLNSASFSATGLAAFAADWFTRGRLVWDSGGEAEVSAHQLQAGEAVLELLDAPGAVLTPGAGFSVYAGCDKRHETCRVKFANVINFRGFPHMPGNDALMAGPISGQAYDGGSRWNS
jgi:uncharacterized phage protein (TIGR02218 family)